MELPINGIILRYRVVPKIENAFGGNFSSNRFKCMRSNFELFAFSQPEFNLPVTRFCEASAGRLAAALISVSAPGRNLTGPTRGDVRELAIQISFDYLTGKRIMFEIVM